MDEILVCKGGPLYLSHGLYRGEGSRHFSYRIYGTITQMPARWHVIITSCIDSIVQETYKRVRS